MGSRVIAELLRRGHTVRALVRRGSESKLPASCAVVVGNALEKESYAGAVRPADTFVQLVGVSHRRCTGCLSGSPPLVRLRGAWA